MKTSRYSEQEDAIIKRQFGKVLASSIAEKLGRSIKSVEKRAKRLGVRSKVKGGQLYQNPHNKGKKYEAGPAHHCWREIGEVWEYKGNLYSKNDEGQIKKLAHINWESENGKIPDGYVVAFTDGNRKNCEFNNLQIISRSEHGAKVLKNADRNYEIVGAKLWMRHNNRSFVDAVLAGKII